MGRIRSKPSPGVVLGVIAILIALSGTSIALPGKNSVDSGDIKKNAVKTGDVKNQNLKGADVAANTLTGSDINESSLGTVPRAATASPSGPAGGDLAASYPNPTVGPNKIDSANVVNDSLTGDDLGPGSVAASELGDIDVHEAQGSIIDTAVDDNFTGSGNVVAPCDPGEQLIGAAARWNSPADEVAIRELKPDFAANTVTGIGVSDAGGGVGNTQNFVVTAICLK